MHNDKSLPEGLYHQCLSQWVCSSNRVGTLLLAKLGPIKAEEAEIRTSLLWGPGQEEGTLLAYLNLHILGRRYRVQRC